MVFKEICIAIKNLPFFLQVLLLQSLKNVNTMEREGETKAHTHTYEQCLISFGPSGAPKLSLQH